MEKINILVDPKSRKSHINKEIYGHFTEHLGRCIYGGIYVGKESPIPNTDGIRNDVIEAFRKIKVPVLRWPGGCFADEYHWKDGIGDPALRKKMINTNWGGVTEDNSFGTHEFMRLCELVGAEPYISGNVGSGTVQELSEWIEYMTFDGVSPMADLRRKNGREKAWKLKYLGVGNENWGCGGNMRPDYYIDLYRRFQTFCRNYSGNQLYKIACGPGGGGKEWTEWTYKLMSAVNSDQMSAISLHYYTLPTGNWQHKGSSTEFSDEEYYSTIEKTFHMEDLIRQHDGIMTAFDPQHKIGLIVDEWGCWYDVEPGTNPGFLYQQNTMRDAIVAAVNLNIFNNHSDRVVMANIAQAVNVLQSVLLTEGAEMVKTPTYHVFDLYSPHMDGTLLYSHADELTENNVPCLSVSASADNDGKIHITAANTSLTKALSADCTIPYIKAASASARMLNAEIHSLNSFENKENVVIKDCPVSVTGTGISFDLPPASVISAEVIPE